MLFLVWTVVFLAAVTLYLRQLYSKFNRYGVKHFKPLPILGNFGRLALKLEPLSKNVEDIYSAFPEERFVGRFEFIQPTVMIRDIELVKKITIKDFEHFLDHRATVDENTDPFFGRNLFSLKGQEWKDMRSTLSPAFTSSKIRHMLPFMVEVGDEMVMALKKKIKESEVGYIDIEAKDLTSRYTNDVIASCAFGLKVNSHAEENNLFYRMGKEISSLKFLQLIKFIFYSACPQLMTKLKMTMFSKASTDYFKGITIKTMQERDLKKIVRPDMIHLLMEAKKGTLSHEKTVQDADAGFATVEESSIGKKETNKEWSDNDLIAQAVIFFVAGFDTISTVMSFALHELAVNPDIQEKLVQEIRQNQIKNNGKFDYNTIQEMTYLDMVVSEVLRLWPPGIIIDRRCIKDYNLGKPNDKASKDYIVRKGEGIDIPIWAIHRDPKFFPDPLKFDPERFSEENKHKIKPFSYIPFGIGPRNCIGSRFALCEVKVMIYHLLQHMEVSPCEKTCTSVPPKLCTNSFTPSLKGGHWIRLKIRS